MSRFCTFLLCLFLGLSIGAHLVVPEETPETTPEESLCAYLRNHLTTTSLQAVTPLNLTDLPATLSLIVNGTAYTLPYTDWLVDRDAGSLLLSPSSLTTLGAWQNVSWLRKLEETHGGVRLVQANRYLTSGSLLLTRVSFRGANDTNDGEETMPPQECTIKSSRGSNWTDDLIVSCLPHSLSGSLTSGQPNQSVFAIKGTGESESTFHLATGDYLGLGLVGHGSKYAVRLGATQAAFWKVETAKAPDEPESKHRIPSDSPVFGFIHSGTMHLWLPGSGVVLLIEDPRAQLEVGQPEDVLLVKLRSIPFERYFVCTADKYGYFLKTVVALAVGLLVLGLLCTALSRFNSARKSLDFKTARQLGSSTSQSAASKRKGSTRPTSRSATESVGRSAASFSNIFSSLKEKTSKTTSKSKTSKKGSKAKSRRAPGLRSGQAGGQTRKASRSSKASSRGASRGKRSKKSEESFTSSSSSIEN